MNDEFVLPLPPSINQTYKKGRGKSGKQDNFYVSEEVKEWREQAGWEIKQAWKNRKPIDTLCSVDIRLYLKRDRDLDNSTKLIFDLLEKQGVIENDILIGKAELTKFVKGAFEIGKPRVTVQISII